MKYRHAGDECLFWLPSDLEGLLPTRQRATTRPRIHYPPALTSPWFQSATPQTPLPAEALPLLPHNTSKTVNRSPTSAPECRTRPHLRHRRQRQSRTSNHPHNQSSARPVLYAIPSEEHQQILSCRDQSPQLKERPSRIPADTMSRRSKADLMPWSSLRSFLQSSEHSTCLAKGQNLLP